MFILFEVTIKRSISWRTDICIYSIDLLFDFVVIEVKIPPLNFRFEIIVIIMPLSSLNSYYCNLYIAQQFT